MGIAALIRCLSGARSATGVNKSKLSGDSEEGRVKLNAGWYDNEITRDDTQTKAGRGQKHNPGTISHACLTLAGTGNRLPRLPRLFRLGDQCRSGNRCVHSLDES
jgi:hypothetical protein